MVIYKITCLIDNKIYIGQTRKKLSERWAQHICQVRYVKEDNNRKICRYLHTAMKKYGVENFKIEIIEECSSIEELNKKEFELIQELNSLAPNGYNLQLGGDSRVASEETRKKLSEKLSGKNNPMYGRAGSEKQKAWLREYNKKPRTESWRKNCKKAQQERASLGLNKGFTRKKTPEEIEKSRSKLLKTYKFLSPSNDLYIIPDIHKFAKEFGFNARSLRKAYQYRRKYKEWTPVYE